MLAERGLRRNGPFGPTLQVAGRLFAKCGGVRAPVRFRAVDRSEVALQRPVVQFAPGVPQELWDADWASVRECHPKRACRRGRLRAKDAQPGGALPLRLVQRILRCFDQGEPDRGPSQSRRLTDTDAQGRTTRLFAEKLSDALDLSNDLARIVFEKAQGKLVTADSRADLIGSAPLADDAAEVSEQPISLCRAVPLVEQGEVVHVEEDKREPLLLCRKVRERLEELAGVRQSGQTIHV